MAIAKWIGGFLGFITQGPLGALAGFALGALFDAGIDAVNVDSPERKTSGGADRNGPFGAGASNAYRMQQAYEEQRNAFRFSLLVLASYIIKADGKIMHSEMETVRRFLHQNFGSQAVVQGEEILLKLFEQQKRMGSSEYRTVIGSACQQIAMHMDYAQRLQMLSFLVMIAQADGRIVTEELNALREVAAGLGISPADIDSMLHLRENDLDAAYKVLGVAPDASDEEIRAAYRRMALKHHPDRVATLGEEVRKAAEKKFQEINEAKARIDKARGL